MPATKTRTERLGDAHHPEERQVSTWLGAALEGMAYAAAIVDPSRPLALALERRRERERRARELARVRGRAVNVIPDRPRHGHVARLGAADPALPPPHGAGQAAARRASGR